MSSSDSIKGKATVSDVELSPTAAFNRGSAPGSSSSSQKMAVAGSPAGEDEESLRSNDSAGPVLAHFSTLSLIGTSLSILNTWNAATQAIYTSLPAGGNTAMLYGMLAGGFGSFLIAMTLGEVCHILPLSGGQYHWMWVLAPPAHRRWLSYLTGWLACAGWIILTASAPYFAASLTLNIISGFHPDYEQTAWQFWLVYMAFTLYATIVSAFGARLFDIMNRVSMWSSDASAITIFITLLSCAGSDHRLNSAKFVFTDHINQTGWPDGVAWIIGLLQAQYALVGVDGATHLVGEVENAHINAPKAMVFASLLGSLHGFVVLIAIAATITDPFAIIDAGASAMQVAFTQGIGNLAGGTALTVLALFTFMFNTPALLTGSSRVVQSFAVDRQMPLHRYLGHTSEKFETPVWAILFCTLIMTILGCLEFASDTTLAAILNSSVVLIQSSYLPTMVLVLMNRKHLHLHATHKTKYNLGSTWGPIVNFSALAYITVTSIFFFFPAFIPLTSPVDMNWTVAVVGVVLFLALVNYVLFARRGGSVPTEVRNKMGLDFDERHRELVQAAEMGVRRSMES